MADLDVLRPEVNEAVHAIDHGNGVFVDSDDDIGAEKWRIVRAELMRLATIEADALIALDCEHDWQVEHKRAEKAEAELLRLTGENADLKSSIELDEQVWVQRDETLHRWIERARTAEAELAALKARVNK